MVGAGADMINDKDSAADAARGAADEPGGDRSGGSPTAVAAADAGGAGPDDARSPRFALLPMDQQQALTREHATIKIAVRLQTARTHKENLIDRARELEATQQRVPEDLARFIDDANEREDVSWARYNARVGAASTAAAKAYSEKNANLEWAARDTINILQGRGNASHLDMLGKPSYYEPPLPEEDTTSQVVAADKKRYEEAAIDYHRARSMVAKFADNIHHFAMQNLSPPANLATTYKSALAKLLKIETAFCDILIEANRQCSPGAVAANPEAAFYARRTVAWALGGHPPSRHEKPKPATVRTENAFALLDTDAVIAALPVDDEEYEIMPSSQENTEELLCPTPPRTAKTRVPPQPDSSQTQQPTIQGLPVADSIGIVRDVVAHRIAEAHSHIAAAKALAIAGMEKETGTEEGNDKDDHSDGDDSGTEPKSSAEIDNMVDANGSHHGLEAARALAATTPITGGTATDTRKKSVTFAPEVTDMNFTAAHMSADMTPKDRTIVAGNKRFLASLAPRLDGTLPPPPCNKCDNQSCFLKLKGRGLTAPYQVVLQGQRCQLKSTLPVLLAAWYAAGITRDMIPDDPAPASSTHEAPVQPLISAPTGPAPVLTPEQINEQYRQDRTRDTENAVLVVERIMQDLIAEQQGHRERMEQQQMENARITVDAETRLAVAAQNLSNLRSALTNGTVPVLDVMPPPAPAPRSQQTLAAHAVKQYIKPPATIAYPGAQFPPPAPTSAWGAAHNPSLDQFPTLASAANINEKPAAPGFVSTQCRNEARAGSYSHVLKRAPRQSPSSPNETSRREAYCMSHLDFILITNFVHQEIRKTKKDFEYYLEPGTHILHIRRMQFDSIELIVPRWQAASISQQLRQMGFHLKRDYHPTNSMVRRRPEESAARAAERGAYCAHRAFSKVADCDRTQPVVRAWFANAAAKVEAALPDVFKTEAHSAWREKIMGEARARRAAEEHKTSDAKDKTSDAEDKTRTSQVADKTPIAKENNEADKSALPPPNGAARDNAFPAAK